MSPARLTLESTYDKHMPGLVADCNASTARAACVHCLRFEGVCKFYRLSTSGRYVVSNSKLYTTRNLQQGHAKRKMSFYLKLMGAIEYLRPLDLKSNQARCKLAQNRRPSPTGVAVVPKNNV